MAVSDDVMQYLIDESVCTAKGTDIFFGEWPDNPDTALFLRETGGVPGQKGFGVAGLQHEFPGFQVMARQAKGSGAYDAARLRCAAAVTAIAKIGPRALDGTTYLFATILQSPMDMGRDSVKRPRFVFNFILQKENT